jgi:hypothetical protein
MRQTRECDQDGLREIASCLKVMMKDGEKLDLLRDPVQVSSVEANAAGSGGV